MYFTLLNVIWVGKFLYKKGWEITSHTHKFFHLLFVAGGKGRITIEGIEYEMNANDLFLCPPGYEHSFISDKTFPLKTIEVKFNIYQDALYNDIKDVHGKIAVNLPDIKFFFEDLTTQARERKQLYKEIISANIFTILMKILGSIGGNNENEVHIGNINITNYSYKDVDFHIIFDYIYKNLNSPLNLKELASLVHVDPTHLCHIFKEKYYISPIQYVSNLKLKMAKELLANSELSITEIAENLGFQTVHYFSRYFKKKEKVSPKEFKRKINSAITVSLEENLISPVSNQR